MYLPKHFSSSSPNAAQWLVRHYPLAQLMRLDEAGHLVCDPVPLIAREPLEAGSSLFGHVARANPLWRQEGPVLAVFTGPQAYISPNAYPSKAEHHRVVPTYNYVTAQVHGQLVAHDDADKTLAIVRQLTKLAEQPEPRPWSVDDAPADFVQANLRAIVGIEIVIESVTAKFKLSQNRSSADFAGVLEYLATQPTDGDADAMLKIMNTAHKSP